MPLTDALWQGWRAAERELRNPPPLTVAPGWGAFVEQSEESATGGERIAVAASSREAVN